MLTHRALRDFPPKPVGIFSTFSFVRPLRNNTSHNSPSRTSGYSDHGILVPEETALPVARSGIESDSNKGGGLSLGTVFKR